MSRNSRVILAKNIKLDKNYKSVLKYSETQMIELMLNSSNLVFQSTTCSFIREDNIINVKAEYETCIQANYVAFQNPDYSNKWFFGFIDEVRYLNNGVCEIHFTTDIFTTWWNYWSPKACFTIREHVEDDTVGLHTVPENLELGEYVDQDVKYIDYVAPDNRLPVICMAVTEIGIPGTVLSSGNQVYNNVYSGLTYLAFKTVSDANIYLKASQDQYDSKNIYSIFIAPYYLCVNTDNDWQHWTYSSSDCYLAPVKYTTSATLLKDSSLLKLTYLDKDYTPVNKKLLTWPYVYFVVSNNAGSAVEYHYELFRGNTCKFKVYGAITTGCNIKLIPYDYKNGTESTENTLGKIIDGLDAEKLPTCAWVNEPYANFLRQNALNIPIQIGTNLFKVGTGDVSGLLGIANTVSEVYQHSRIPSSAQGGASQCVLNYAMNETFNFYLKSIKKEYAQICDNFFTRMGYKINRIKVPNMSHRENFNFVQVGAEENLAYPNNYNNIGIPASALNEINEMFRTGITLWNNHANFGDYSVSNNITT